MSCGIPDAAVPLEEAELLHSGFVLVCPECGGETVFDLWNPAQRAAFYGRIERAEQERDAARKWAAAWKRAARAMRKAMHIEAQLGQGGHHVRGRTAGADQGDGVSRLGRMAGR